MHIETNLLSEKESANEEHLQVSQKLKQAEIQMYQFQLRLMSLQSYDEGKDAKVDDLQNLLDEEKRKLKITSEKLSNMTLHSQTLSKQVQILTESLKLQKSNKTQHITTSKKERKTLYTTLQGDVQDHEEEQFNALKKSQAHEEDIKHKLHNTTEIHIEFTAEIHKLRLQLKGNNNELEETKMRLISWEHKYTDSQRELHNTREKNKEVEAEHKKLDQKLKETEMQIQVLNQRLLSLQSDSNPREQTAIKQSIIMDAEHSRDRRVLSESVHDSAAESERLQTQQHDAEASANDNETLDQSQQELDRLNSVSSHQSSAQNQSQQARPQQTQTLIEEFQRHVRQMQTSDIPEYHDPICESYRELVIDALNEIYGQPIGLVEGLLSILKLIVSFKRMGAQS